MERKYVLYDDSCTGCGLCSVVCPVDCISMQENSEGFLVPVVDEDVCLNCGACKLHCPRYAMTEHNHVLSAYAVRTRNIDDLMKSTSGGFFGVLAEYVLSQGGLVCGAAYEDMCVRHICIDDIAELYRLKGSKYVQSDITGVYEEVRKSVASKRIVLFSGCACEIAAMKEYVSYSPFLLTMEVVCHGVPSPGLFRKQLGELEKRIGESIVRFSFRGKQHRSTGEHSEFYYSSFDKDYMGHAYENPYYASFLEGHNLRESCYNCMYKGMDRVADFTAGDFWGVENLCSDLDSSRGVSLVFLNTEEARRVFDVLSGRMEIKSVEIDDAIRKNPSIIQSCHSERFRYSLDDDMLFKNMMNQSRNIKNIIKNRLPVRLKYFLKKVL